MYLILLVINIYSNLKMKGLSKMYAIIDVGGKQYKVKVGDKIFLEKLNAKEKETYSFNNVVALVEDKKSDFGAPFLKGVSVSANVLKNGRQKKIRVFKYKPKKNYSRRFGHRQHYSQVEITAINS